MSRKGHTPIRVCIGCRKRREKQEMFRFAHKADGTVVIDKRKKEEGRGFYLCPDPICLRMALRNRRFSQVLKPAISPLSFDRMEGLT